MGRKLRFELRVCRSSGDLATCYPNLRAMSYNVLLWSLNAMLTDRIADCHLIEPPPQGVWFWRHADPT
jgi:hypothetical protein